ncbi:hypothetical protein OQA88_6214 [Cercophora sp. LCS_1]
MSERSSRPSRRDGDRSSNDTSDRRDRYARGGRDRDYDHREHRRDDNGRERDRNRDRDSAYRKQRSRSRDRRDRRRSRSPLRDRGYGRRDERLRGGAEDRESRRRDEGRDHRDRNGRDGKDKDREQRRSISPRRSASPQQLPTRTKPAAPSAPAAPVSFRVKGQDRKVESHGHEEHPQGGNQDGHDDRQHDQGETSRDRFGAEPMDEDETEDVIVEEDGLDAMQAMLGFGGFGTTKGQKVLGNNVGAVRKEKKTEYRQYMNRVGGFNRPLSPGR